MALKNILLFQKYFLIFLLIAMPGENLLYDTFMIWLDRMLGHMCFCQDGPDDP